MAAPTIEALNPTKGDSFTERWMPLIVGVVTVGVAVAAIFGFIPEMDASDGIVLLSGAGAGIAIRSQG